MPGPDGSEYPKISDERRSEIWRSIWNRRDESLVDRNGFESCFPELQLYRSFVKTVARLIVDTMSISTSDHVVDLGCGTGQIASQVAEWAASVLGIDYSEHALEIARTRRAARNIKYQWGDLTRLDTSTLDAKITKAYSMGVFLYLDDYDTVKRLLDSLLARGIEVLVLDVPDAKKKDEVTRPYDMNRYSHLYFDEDRLRSDYSKIEVLRDVLPDNPNNPVRFGFHLRP